jgi:hypothetical protein
MSSMRWTRRPSPAFVIALLALFLAVSGTSYAAGRTHFLRLGKTSKTSGATALVSKNKQHPALALTSIRKQTAASFTTPKGVAPFSVNQTTKVTDLNADLLDGLDSSALQRTVTGTCASGSSIRTIAPAGTVTCESFPSPPAVAPAWRLAGNTGTSTANDFLGTTDAQPLVVKTNNKEAMRVTAAGNLGVGTTTPSARVDVVGAGAQAGVSGASLSAAGLAGSSTSGNGVTGTSATADGLGGISNTGPGVFGQSSGIGVWGTSSTRGVVGTLGGTSCAGTYAVGACGATIGDGLDASSTNGVGVSASSTNGIALIANSGAADAFEATTQGGDAVRTSTGTGVAVDGFSTSNLGVWGHSASGVGVRADGASQAVVAALGGASCGGATSAVTACGVSVGDGVQGSSANNSGIVGTTAHPSGGGTAAGVIANNTGGGDIFIGEANGTHVARINSAGAGFFDGGVNTSGADYAESVRAVGRAHLHPGDVLSVASGHGYAVTAAHGRYSPRVMGVYSTRPAVLAIGKHRIGQSLAGQVPVAMMGVVPTKVTAAGGAIRPGDLLTTSRVPGYAMRAKPVRIRGIAIYPQGTILGKALQPLRHGRGVIRVLLMSR